MLTVQKARTELFDKVYPLLEYFAVQSLDREGWFELLSNRWSQEYDHFGYVLMDDERVVGFIGTLFSSREAGGSSETFCNLFCWHVLEKYRNASLLLLRPVLQLRDVTVTALTSSRGATAVYKRFGFLELDREVCVFPLLPSIPGRKGLKFISDGSEISRILSVSQRKIASDHSRRFCRQLIMVDSVSGDYCYLLYNRIRKKGLPFTQIYHVSNHQLLKRGFSRLQYRFLRENRTVFTVMDKRITGPDKLGAGFSYALRYPRLYLSKRLGPKEIDNLYSELLFLRVM